MRRFQLFEIEDQAWFPDSLRNYMTDFLRTVAERFNLFGPSVPLLAEIMEKSDSRRVIDLASGGGGQWRTLLPQLQSLVPDATLVLTDLYPNTPAFEKLAMQSEGTIQYEQRSVSATSVPEDLGGLRTMFLSLHHFEPHDAQAILENAVHDRAPIAVFEAQCRDTEHVLKFSMSPIMVLLITPLIRPFSILRLLFTYLIPILPVAVGFDGVVSVLRTYSPDELLQFAGQADPEHAFEWQADIVKQGQQKITYLTGIPKSR